MLFSYQKILSLSCLAAGSQPSSPAATAAFWASFFPFFCGFFTHVSFFPSSFHVDLFPWMWVSTIARLCHTSAALDPPTDGLLGPLGVQLAPPSSGGDVVRNDITPRGMSFLGMRVQYHVLMSCIVQFCLLDSAISGLMVPLRLCLAHSLFRNVSGHAAPPACFYCFGWGR